MRLIFFIFLSWLLAWQSVAAAIIKEVNNPNSGKLSTLIDTSFYSADSLIVSGSLDEADMAVLKDLTQRGKLTGLNLKKSSIVAYGGFWFTNNPYDPDSLQVKLRYVHLPDDCNNIDEFAFANVKTLVGLYKDYIPGIYPWVVFSTGCLKGTSIKVLDFGPVQLQFHPYALQDAVELVRIEGIGQNTLIWEAPFYNTPNLKGSVTFDNETWLSDRVFSYSGWDEIILKAIRKVEGEDQFSFANAKKIVIESESMVTVPRRAFYGCQNLKSLSLPASVDTLKENCLNQTGLETLTLPEGLKYIESNVMGWNIFLKEIVFPSTLQCIGYDNGQYWRSLEKIYVKAQTPPECILKGGGTGFFYAFTGANYNATLYVPRGTLEAYRNAPGWNYFTNIEEFDFSDIKQIKILPENRPRISTGKGFMFLESPESTPFTVFDIDGHKVQSGEVNGTFEISLSSGLYLIRFGDETQKVLVK